MEFWYSIGSTYSFLTVMRLPALAEARDLAVTWRPFNVRAIMREMHNIPFADKPAKSAYMWRDIERRAHMYGLEPRLPAPYPLKELERANRVAVIGLAEGWGIDYTVETYRLWFYDGLEAGSEPNLSESIRRAGADPGRVLPMADGREGVDGLAAATLEARNRGIFGSPNILVGEELFWGDDRLEDAMAWARPHAPSV